MPFKFSPLINAGNLPSSLPDDSFLTLEVKSIAVKIVGVPGVECKFAQLYAIDSNNEVSFYGQYKVDVESEDQLLIAEKQIQVLPEFTGELNWEQENVI